MQSRRNFVLAASVLTTAGVTARAIAADQQVVDYLLVQTAKGLTFDKAISALLWLLSIPAVLLDQAMQFLRDTEAPPFLAILSHVSACRAGVLIYEADLLSLLQPEFFLTHRAVREQRTRIAWQ